MAQLIRLQKFLSAAGVCSRRAAEVFITKGQVTVNGQVATLGDRVDPANDTVTLKGKIINPAHELIYLALNKPTGYTTTRADLHAEKTIYNLLPKELKNKVWPIGRLDKKSCGLLIMTNDGELTQQLTHPSFRHEKEYLVRFMGELTPGKVKQLERGVRLQGKTTAPAKIKIIKPREVYFTITEGQKHQIRRMFDRVNCSVTWLQRLRENKLTLGTLEKGRYRMIKKSDIV
ncbi:rRNA pseudouridine synthase [Candidatus Falkowbacteria bacterium]|nr:rRNA pseudouridine synthase [Candidatus Falkowbacteria bacterium]